MIPEQLEGHPPSDKLVFHFLDQYGPMSMSELVSDARLPIGTASAAIRRLRQDDIITGRPDPQQPDRRQWYVDGDFSN